jgi:hypothetical protein
VELIHNYDKLQTKKRIKAVFIAGRSLIKEVDEEDLDVSTELPSNFKQTEGEINHKLDQLEKYIVHRDDDAISDLHTVHEDSSDDSPECFLHTQQEYIDHIYQTVEYDFIAKEIAKNVIKVQKVRNALLNWIRKRRYEKME